MGGACATSDQVLEKKRRDEQLAAGGYTCSTGHLRGLLRGRRGDRRDAGPAVWGDTSCVDEVWGPCEGQVLPTDELCNGIDDNCDGVVDNGFERDGALCSYQGARGACKTKGKWHCSPDGTSSQCDAPLVKPTAGDLQRNRR